LPPGISFQPDEPVGALPVRVFEMSEGPILFAQSHVDDRDGIARSEPSLLLEVSELFKD
jgi:hypothetical protein